jgi:hypothetical protein
VIPKGYGRTWNLILDTSRLQPEPEPRPVIKLVTGQARSVILLQAP